MSNIEDKLKVKLRGEILTPSSPNFEAHAKLYNGMPVRCVFSYFLLLNFFDLQARSAGDQNILLLLAVQVMSSKRFDLLPNTT